jgi:hypothetical protein
MFIGSFERQICESVFAVAIVSATEVLLFKDSLMICKAREVLLKGRVSAVDLLILTSLDAAFNIENIITICTEQATIMRRSTVLSPPLELVFPGQSFTFVSVK